MDTRCCTQVETGQRSNGVGIIVNVEISKEVVRMERWQGRIIAVWMMIRQDIYGPQTGRTEAEKKAFRGEEVGRMAGLIERRSDDDARALRAISMRTSVWLS